MTWKTILVGIDEEEASQRALERAAELAEAPGAELVVTSVAPVRTGMATSHGVGPWNTADSPADHRAELDKAQQKLSGRDVHAEFVLGAGEPAETIVDLADERDADLIVVGTREPSTLERVVNGSVSRAVARKAHVDVLIVH